MAKMYFSPLTSLCNGSDHFLVIFFSSYVLNAHQSYNYIEFMFSSINLFSILQEVILSLA